MYNLLTKEVIMPRGDRTGPLGEGPLTGLKRGRCADNNAAGGFGGFGFGRGNGRGLGNGRSWGGRWFSNTENSETELGLKSAIDALKNQLAGLENRLNKIKSND